MPLVTPTLHTERLLLRPFREKDGEDLYAPQSDARALEFWDSPPWTDRGHIDRFLDGCRRMADEGSGVRIAVVRRSDDQFIGWLTFNSWDPTFRSASLGFCFVETAWGCGYATASADALLTWAYATLDVNRVQAETDTRNPGSARVLEKLGFVREGMLRQDCIVNGVVSDSWVYGLLRSDWENTTTASVGGVLGTEAAATPRVSS